MITCMDSVQTSGEESQLYYTFIYIDVQLNIQAADVTDLVIRNFRPWSKPPYCSSQFIDIEKNSKLKRTA